MQLVQREDSDCAPQRQIRCDAARREVWKETIPPPPAFPDVEHGAGMFHTTMRRSAMSLSPDHVLPYKWAVGHSWERLEAQWHENASSVACRPCCRRRENMGLYPPREHLFCPPRKQTKARIYTWFVYHASKRNRAILQGKTEQLCFTCSGCSRPCAALRTRDRTQAGDSRESGDESLAASLASLSPRISIVDFVTTPARST
jgi:hypothetical protein